MKFLSVLVLLVTFKACVCIDIKELFEVVNKKTEKFNALAAEIAWESSINPASPNLQIKAAKYQKDRIIWQQNACDELATLHNRHLLNSTQSRQTYLLCRGPKYTFNEARLSSNLYEQLQTIYSEVEVCIPIDKKVAKENLAQVEDAILEYLTKAKHFLKMDYINNQTIEIAVKIASNEETRGEKICLKGEDDFQNMMAFSRNGPVLEWLWLVWREKVGPPMKEPYRKLVDVENAAARRNGYTDIGASWRDEQEIPNLRGVCRSLYNTIQPLYTLLHGVVRYYLRREYGSIVPERGPIPAHLLGNLWSQNWEPLADLILPKTLDLDGSIHKLNWTVEHMVKRAEDFYRSFGLPPMTEIFWKKSVFKRDSENTKCHGAAADMFNKNDFRLLYCSGTKMDDFYVLHHELGHIQYYMAYENQPALFRLLWHDWSTNQILQEDHWTYYITRDNRLFSLFLHQANTAFHEAIGDTIMYGVMTPQHLHRLGLINDSVLYDTGQEKLQILDAHNQDDNINTPIDNEYNNNRVKPLNDVFNENDADEKVYSEKSWLTTDDILILKQALNKIPQIPFSLLVEEYRWKYFEGDFNSLDMNEAFWQMALELQGIAPPVKRGLEYFDVGAKFHVPDNTPYIRYFLSSFLQHQLFESLCRAAVFGRRDAKDPLPDSIAIHRCDIYGSKSAGKLLKDFMSRGHSQHWQQILQETTGQDDISASALERYYRPLYKLLMKLVHLHRIPIGW